MANQPIPDASEPITTTDRKAVPVWYRAFLDQQRRIKALEALVIALQARIAALE